METGSFPADVPQKDNEVSSSGELRQVFPQVEESRNLRVLFTKAGERKQRSQTTRPSTVPPPTYGLNLWGLTSRIPKGAGLFRDGIRRKGSDEPLAEARGFCPGPPGNPPVTFSKDVPSKGGHRRSKT